MQNQNVKQNLFPLDKELAERKVKNPSQINRMVLFVSKANNLSQ